jgi:hypothetical protein
MAVMREWNCIEHGAFDGTHPICPGNGCASKHVTQEFRTPVGIGTDFKRRFDAGIRKSSEMYQISDFKSAKAGDVSFAGRTAPGGEKLLWGDDCKKVMGRSFAELTQVAQKPLTVKARNGENLTLTKNNGMRDAATAAGITQRRLPQAHEVTAHRAEKGAKEKAVSITA